MYWVEDYPARVYTNNGAKDFDIGEVEDVLEEVPWNVLTSYMDPDTMEAVHNELPTCNNEEFLTRYLELARVICSSDIDYFTRKHRHYRM